MFEFDVKVVDVGVRRVSWDGSGSSVEERGGDGGGVADCFGP